MGLSGVEVVTAEVDTGAVVVGGGELDIAVTELHMWK